MNVWTTDQSTKYLIVFKNPSPSSQEEATTQTRRGQMTTKTKLQLTKVEGLIPDAFVTTRFQAADTL